MSSEASRDEGGDIYLVYIHRDATRSEPSPLTATLGSLGRRRRSCDYDIHRPLWPLSVRLAAPRPGPSILPCVAGVF
jgi:hypothetical protein